MCYKIFKILKTNDKGVFKKNMGSSKRNLLTSVLLLVVMGVFAVLTIFIVVDAINKKYYNDIKVEYEVQEESPNVILTFARNEGSNFSTDNTKVVLNEDKQILVQIILRWF